MADAQTDNTRLNSTDKKIVFKYNMSFYYQSTIIYFVVFIIYVIIRGEFFEGSFILNIKKDPIIYFFGIIVLISLVSLLYNLYKNKHLEISEEGISFIDRFKTKSFRKEEMDSIIISRRRDTAKKNVFRFVRIKLKSRRRPVIIRPYDYENENDLIDRIHELKSEVEK